MKIPKFKVWHITNKIDIKYELGSWALPIGVRHWYNFRLNCRETIVSFLCFDIRIAHVEKGVIL